MDLLAVVATIGPAADIALVAEVSGISRAVVLDLLDLARRTGIISAIRNDQVEVAHALFREVITAGIGASRSEALHLAIGRALVSRRAAGHTVRAAAIADHLLRSAASGAGAEAVREATAAGQDALAQFAYQEAADWFARAAAALERTPPVDRRRRLELAAAQGDALWRAGDGGTARKILMKAAVAARAESIALLPGLAVALGRVGTLTTEPNPELRTLMVDALAAAEGGGMRARLLASLARYDYHQAGPETDLTAVLALADEAVAEARAAGDIRAQSFCLMARHDAIWRPGTATERAALASEVATLAANAGDPDLAVEAHLLRYTAVLEAGRYPGDDVFGDFTASAARSRQPRHRYLVTSRWATRALIAGRYADSEVLIADAASQARRLGDPDGPVVEFNQRWELLSDLGRRPEACETLEAFSSFSGHPFIWLTLALARLAAGDTAGADAAYASCANTDVVALRPAYVQPSVAALLIEASIALGHPTDGLRVEPLLLAVAGTSAVMGGAVFFHGAVDHHLGVLCAALGRHQEAIERLRRAEAMHERVGAVPWLARTRLALGRVMGGAEGDSLLASSADLAGRVGMVLAIPAAAPNQLVREGDAWSMRWRGQVFHVRDSKGMRDLAVLLASPGTDVGAARLYGAEERVGADRVLDAAARRAYAARLARLDEDEADADRRGDSKASSAVVAEREAIVRELRTATGLGGRSRTLSDPAERARKAVTGRLRDAIARLRAIDASLGDHLAASVVTGSSCLYCPTPPERWSVSGGVHV